MATTAPENEWISDIKQELANKKNVLSFRGGYEPESRIGNGPVFDYLCEALKDRTDKTVLYLDNQGIGNDGVKKLILALKSHKRMLFLNLGENSLTDEGNEALFDYLEEDDTLQELHLDGNSESFSQHDSPACRALVKALTANKTLKILNLRKCGITTKSVKMIASGLENNNGLRELDLGENLITFEGMTHLCKALENHESLKNLIIYSNTFEESASFGDFCQFLKRNQHLKTFFCSANELKLAGNSIFEGISYNNALKNLYAGDCKLGIESAPHIADALKNNNNIKVLDLSNNEFEDDSISIIADGLGANKSLTWLSLAQNPIKSKGWQAIGEVLQTNKSLEYLDLYHAEPGEEGAQALFESMKKNQTLGQIQLGSCQISGIKTAKAIAEMLIVNKSLNELSLADNPFASEELIMISEALRKNNTLEHIDLMCPNADELFFESIATTIIMNNTIKGLTLGELKDNLKYFEMAFNINTSITLFLYSPNDKCENLFSRNQQFRWSNAARDKSYVGHQFGSFFQDLEIQFD